MADEHGPDAPGDDAPKTLCERAVVAIESAFDEEVKRRFSVLAGNEYLPDGLGGALNAFQRGLGDLKEAREKALLIAQKVLP